MVASLVSATLVSWEVGVLATAVSDSSLCPHDFHLTTLDCMNGTVLLMNGSEPTIGQREGRVEICYENVYHTICDDLWDLNDAQVVCRQLGVEGDGKSSRVFCDSRAHHMRCISICCLSFL